MSDTSALFAQLNDESLSVERGRIIPIDKINEPVDGLAPDAQFIESVRMFGILDELKLVKNRARFDIIAGRRRWAAAKSLGITEVPATVVWISGGKRLAPWVMGLVSNRLRSENLIADIRAIERLRSHGYAESDIAAATGLTVQELKRRDALAMADHRIIDFLQAGACSPSIAERVAKLPPNRQTGLLDAFEESGDKKLTSKHLADARMADDFATALPLSLFDDPLPQAHQSCRLVDLFDRIDATLTVGGVEIIRVNGQWVVRAKDNIAEARGYQSESTAVQAVLELLEQKQ